ncbi:MAG: hypothetical protein AAGI48_06740 [Verrucomicrobiota bacterium]
MKEPAYEVSKGDWIHRISSLLILVLILFFEIKDGRPAIWYRFEAAPVLAASAIWFADTFGASLPWDSAPRDIRIGGWLALVLFASLQAL